MSLDGRFEIPTGVVARNLSGEMVILDLERGIYFPPSQFETAFISTAHSDEDIEQTARVVGEALAAL